MRVTTGALEVLESGVVDSAGMSDVDCLVAETPRLWTSFRVRRAEVEAPLLGWHVEDGERLVITLNNPQPNSGPAEPLLIGRLQGRPLHISFRVTVFGDYQSFQVSYTFYLGQAVA